MINRFFIVTGLVAIAIAVLCDIGFLRAQGLGATAHEQVLGSDALKNLPGTNLTAVVVVYGPGAKSPAHHHAGSVFAYVLQGAIRSQNSATGPVRVYQAGSSFFEPAGSVHLISENASPSEPARLLAVFVAPAGAQLTSPEQPDTEN